MASNAELISAILAVNGEAKTADLNNQQLTELLKTEKANAEADAAKAKADEEAEAAKAAKADGFKYLVAARKSITTKRGIIAGGKGIGAADLAGGQAVIDAFVKSGHIVRA